MRRTAAILLLFCAGILRSSGVEARRKNLADAAALVEIAEAMKARIEKESPWVVSVKTVTDTQRIEEITKQIQARLKSE